MTAASATTVIFTQIILIFAETALNVAGVCIRIYGIILAVGVILCEFELTETIRTFIILQNWITKGLSYIFVGLLAYNHTKTRLDNDSEEYVKFSSLSMIILGSIYSMMGVFCMKKLKDDRMAKYVQLLSHLEIQKAIQQGGGRGGSHQRDNL